MEVVAPPYGWDGLKKLFQRATHLKPQLLVDSLVKKYESITKEKSQEELPRELMKPVKFVQNDKWRHAYLL